MQKTSIFLMAVTLLILLNAACSEQGESPSPAFGVVEASFAEMQAAITVATSSWTL